ISVVKYSPDGHWLAAADLDGTINLWHYPGGSFVFSLREHRFAVLSMAFSPDGTILASVGDGAEGKLWDVRRRKLLGNLPGIKGPVDAVAFAPDGKTLATVNRVNNQPNENYITIWDIVQRKQNFTIPVGRIGYKTVIFAGNAETLVAGAYGGRVDY